MSPEPDQRWKSFPIQTLVAPEESLVVGQMVLFVLLKQEQMRKLFAAFGTTVDESAAVGVNHGHVTPEGRVVKLLLTDLAR